MGKVCTGCGYWKRDDFFHANGDGLHSRCKACRSVSQRTAVYSVTEDWYDARMQEQGGCCAICGTGELNLVVDHDHACCPGRSSCGLCVRALICHDCNWGLGNFHDDPDRLTRAVEYLDEHKPWEG